MAEQYYQYSQYLDEYQQLWAAVMLRAIWDLAHVKTATCRQENPGKNRKYCDICAGKEQAIYWINNSRDYFGSFPAVCEILGIDPDFLKQRLLGLI